jgi:NAD+ diphosphatase
MQHPGSAPDGLGYVGDALDRCGVRREDPAFIAAEACSPASRSLLFLDQKLVLKQASSGALDLLFDAAEAVALGADPAAIFLGREAEAPRFARTLPAGAAVPKPILVEDLRTLASDGRLSGPALALAGCARSLIAWHARHRFCANCGAGTEAAPSGWRRQCPACGAQHFPRLDPVVIMLVTRGDRCLLGREGRFPPGMWSCLAGFVEPGETIEEAARREAMEEAGVPLGAVAYAFCQPWPFPSQLMLGLVAEALADDLVPDLSELADARWFTREEVALMLARGHPEGFFAPPPAAIAHHLMGRFVAG